MAVPGQLQGSYETALFAAGEAACLADAGQHTTQKQAPLVFTNRASTALQQRRTHEGVAKHHSIQNDALLQNDGTAALPPLGQLGRHKA